MKKYLHLYLLLLRLNFSALLAYRAGFINNVIGTTGWSLVSISATFLLTARTTNVYGWTPNELLITAGIYVILIGIFHALFSRNFEKFSRIVNLGQLDNLLLKPVDTQFVMSLYLFGYASFLRISIGIIFVLFMLQKMHIALTIMSISIFIFLSVAAILLLYSIWYSILTLTIWLTTLTNLVDFLYSFNYFGKFPPEMIIQSKNIFLYVLLPITFVATIPTKVILQKSPIVYMELLVFFSLFSFLFSRAFWKFALRFYTSAGG